MSRHHHNMIKRYMSPEMDLQSVEGQCCVLCHKIFDPESCCHVTTIKVGPVTTNKGKLILAPTLTQIHKCPKGAGCNSGITPVVTFYHKHGYACTNCANDKANRPDIQYFSHSHNHNGNIQRTKYTTFDRARKEDNTTLNVVYHRISRVLKHKKIRASIERLASARKWNTAVSAVAKNTTELLSAPTPPHKPETND